MTLLRDLVARWRALAAQPLPAHVLRAAELHLLDALGVGLAASRLAPGAPWASYARTLPSGPAGVLGQHAGAPPADAALCNGGLIHALEFDDTHTASIVHGSAVVAPAALAAGQAAGAAGNQVLLAYALGWEVLARIGLAAPGGFQAAGFQVTSVGGAPVAALVAAWLMRLDADGMMNAAAIALSQAGGTFEFLSNGSSVKSLHPGWAAHGGVTAAALAAAGLMGPETALEGRYGLFAAFTRDAASAERFRALLETLGHEWHLPDAAFKLLPCCHYIHPFVEAASQLPPLAPDSIAEALFYVAPGAAAIICEPWETKQAPATPHAARWSLPVAVAAQLAEGRVDLGTFERPPSPEILDLARRMRWEALPDPAFPKRFPAALTVRLRDGTQHSAAVADVLGNAGRPAPEDAVLAKFRRNAGSVPLDAAALEREVLLLHAAPDLDGVTAALASGMPPSP